MIRLIEKDGEWYWRKGTKKMVGPFHSEYAATKNARATEGHDERQNYPRREETQ